MTNRFSVASSFVAFLALCSSCGSKPPVSTNTPVQSGTSDAPAFASAFLFSFTADEMRDLRKRLTESIVVVAYDGKTLEVLPKCSVPGFYTFMMTDDKKATVKLETADEVALNVPSTPHNKTTSSAMSSALVLTGRWTATYGVIERKSLDGDCARATHFIHHLDTGLSALPTATIADCPEDYETDHACAAPLRAHLYPFGAKLDWDEERAMPALHCPANTFTLDQKCAPTKPFEPYACRLGEAAECEKQCTIGNQSSCNTLGWMIARTAQAPEAVTHALKLLERSCQGGDAHACANLAIATVGNDVPLTNGDAADLYGKSCLRGDVEGCLWLGKLLSDIPEAADQTTAVFMQACLGGSTEGCGRRASYLEISGDLVNARSFHQRACSDDFQFSCARLGAMLAHGQGGPVDFPVGKALLEKACENGDMTACGDLGYVYHSDAANQDYTKAAQYYDKACNGGAAYGCRMLAVMYENALGRTRDMTRAAGLFAKGCTIGEADSCLELGRLHVTGEGILKDDKRAAELFDNACQKGLPIACHNLAVLVADGNGVPKDEKRARDLHEKACRVGYARSCRMLGPAKP